MVGETDSEQQRKFGKQTEEMHFNISYTLIQLLLQSFTYCCLLYRFIYYLANCMLYSHMLSHLFLLAPPSVIYDL